MSSDVAAALYAISQIIIFQWRASEPTVLLGLKQAQVTGLVVLFVITPIFWLIWRRTSMPDDRDAATVATPT